MIGRSKACYIGRGSSRQHFVFFPPISRFQRCLVRSKLKQNKIIKKKRQLFVTLLQVQLFLYKLLPSTRFSSYSLTEPFAKRSKKKTDKLKVLTVISFPYGNRRANKFLRECVFPRVSALMKSIFLNGACNALLLTLTFSVSPSIPSTRVLTPGFQRKDK